MRAPTIKLMTIFLSLSGTLALSTGCTKSGFETLSDISKVSTNNPFAKQLLQTASAPTTTLFKNAYSGLCLRAATIPLANGGVLVQGACDIQALSMIQNSVGSAIQLKISGTDFCLDTGRGATANGSPVKIWSCDATAPEQLFVAFGAVSFRLSLSSNICLDIGSSGNAQIWSCDNSNNQSFTLLSSAPTPVPAPAPAPSPAPSSGPTSLLKNTYSGLCMKGSSNPLVTNSNILQGACDSGALPIQQNPYGSAVELRVNGTNFCLDSGSSAINGSIVKLVTCSGASQQRFTVLGSTSYKSVALNKCLDIGGNSNAQIWDCDNSYNQLFTLLSIASAPTPVPAPAPAPTPASNFQFCANEYQTCSAFVGSAMVRYGSTTSYITERKTAPFLCGNGSFSSDPAFGIVKSCSYDPSTIVAGIPVPTPTPAPTPVPPAGGSGSVSATFSSTTLDFMNPERGFYITANESEYGSVSTLNGFVQQYQTRLFMMAEDLGAYRTQNLPSSYLNALSARFANARAAGVKVSFLTAYSYSSGGADTSLNWVLTHAAQLKPILAQNADVIAYVHSGFIGAWGEWHDSTSGIDTKAAKRAVKDAVLDMAPLTSPVLFQQVYPSQEDWYAGQGPLNASEAFSGSAKSRSGFGNFCIMAGPTDSFNFPGQATVVDFNITKSQLEQRQYISALTEYAPFGGETCDTGGTSDPSAHMRLNCTDSSDGAGLSGGILNEGPRYHMTYLNRLYYQGFHNAWINQGCYDQVSRSLGYRFQLDAINHPASISRGSSVNVNVDLHNVGWGRIFSARKLVVTFVHKTNGSQITGSGGDARFLPSQSTSSSRITVNVAIPSGAAVGDYDVYISMPDISPSIANDVRYSVRFANADNIGNGQVYDASTGRFKVGTIINVQ